MFDTLVYICHAEQCKRRIEKLFEISRRTLSTTTRDWARVKMDPCVFLDEPLVACINDPSW